MSHFVTYVLFEKGNKPEEILDELMAPYSENLKVDPYEEKCWCVGRRARDNAYDAFDAAYPNHNKEIDAYREKLRSFDQRMMDIVGPEFERPFASVGEMINCLVDQGASKKLLDPYIDEEKGLTKTWKKFFSKKDKFIKSHIEASPFKDTCDANCEECDATGKVESMYNPKSKWDWYQIGGRWTGTLSDYDPAMDPDNKEECFICHGSGKRYVKDVVSATKPGGLDGAMAREENGVFVMTRPTDSFDPEAKEVDCNGCKGTGISDVWPTNWKDHDGDITTVGHFAKLLQTEGGERKYMPYALVTEDGQWHERGEMGWFGVSSNEMDTDEWYEFVKKIAEEKSDLQLAVVDCHI